jgi:hypothetical protein
MIIVFWVVTILFTIVKSRIIHYSSLAWFPVTFLAAYTFYRWMENENNYKGYIAWISGILGGAIAFALLAVPFFAKRITTFIPDVRDTFVQDNMAADVRWTGWESLIGLGMILTVTLGIWMLRKKAFYKAAWIYFGGTAIVIFLAATIIVPKVERYSQGAAIDFYKERKGEDCYVRPLGYKTYAHLFYTQKMKPENENAYDQNWLLTGAIDKPVYFVTKSDRIDRYQHYTDIKELYRKNGFVFLKRDIPVR